MEVWGGTHPGIPFRVRSSGFVTAAFLEKPS